MVLAFGAFGNEVVTEHAVGSQFACRRPLVSRAPLPLRALVGRMHDSPVAHVACATAACPSQAAVAAAGWAIAAEPWLERYPVCISAVPTPIGNGRWTLADATGAVPIVPGFWRLAEMVAVSGGQPVTSWASGRRGCAAADHVDRPDR